MAAKKKPGKGSCVGGGKSGAETHKRERRPETIDVDGVELFPEARKKDDGMEIGNFPHGGSPLLSPSDATWSQIPVAPLPQQATKNRLGLGQRRRGGSSKTNKSMSTDSSSHDNSASVSRSRTSAREVKKSGDEAEASSSKSRSARSDGSRNGHRVGGSEKEDSGRGTRGVGQRSASREQWQRDRRSSLFRGAEEDWLFQDGELGQNVEGGIRSVSPMELDKDDQGEVSGRGARGRGGGGKRGGRGRRGGGKKMSEGSRTKSSAPKSAKKPSDAERGKQSGCSIKKKKGTGGSTGEKCESKTGRESRGIARSKGGNDGAAAPGGGGEVEGMTWEWVCLAAIPTMKHVPKGIRREWGEIQDFLAKKANDDPNNVEANWRLYMALPKLCLRTPPRGGRKKKGPSPRMCEWTLRLLMKARRGNWKELWEEAEEARKKLEKKQKGGSGAAKRKQVDYVRRRVLELVSEGQYSRACKALLSEGVWELDEDVMEQLRKKHPQGEGWKKADQVECAPEEGEVGEAEEEHDVRVTFSEKQVEKALRSFPKGTAAGGSGWRAQHLLDALDGAVGDGRKEMLKRMGQMCETLANGEAPACIAPWLAGAPIFPLKKKGGGIRPVAVGEMLRRLVAKMLAQDDKVKGAAEELFKEIGQLGVGIKGGAEIVVQAMRTWLSRKGSRGRGVLKLDFENAYNMVDREEIGKQVAKHFPKLLPWFKFCYGVRGVLSCQGERLPFDICDGVQQGDPLGPLFFALGILKMGQKLNGTLKDSLSLWYLDDGSIVGPGDELVQAWDLVRKEAEKVGMRLNVDKCEIWA